jgi:hypothetical protein
VEWTANATNKHNAEVPRDRQGTITMMRPQTKRWLNEHPKVEREGLSQAAIEMLFDMSQNHVAHDRPSFEEVWLQ